MGSGGSDRKERKGSLCLKLSKKPRNDKKKKKDFRKRDKKNGNKKEQILKKIRKEKRKPRGI